MAIQQPSRLVTLVLVLSASAAQLTCGSASPEAPIFTGSFGFAVAKRSCGPLGGPAAEFLLSSVPIQSDVPQAPYVRIQVWRGIEELRCHTWGVSGKAALGSAEYYRAKDDAERAASALLTVLAIHADSIVDLALDLSFARVGRVQGNFAAGWVKITGLCG